MAFSPPPTAPQTPLAESMRPASIDDIVGQEHLTGEGMPLRNAVLSRQPGSMILWGPPGCGKTTVARIIAKESGMRIATLSAVLCGVKDIREEVLAAGAAAAEGVGTVVFVDEVHRFNKSQQDAFLPHVESGLFTFIGATTENPSFSINPALLSRCGVHVLRHVSDEALWLLLDRAQTRLGIPFSKEAGTMLVNFSDGDARRLLSAAQETARAAKAAGLSVVPASILPSTLGKQTRAMQKDGDDFHDQISALHKSIRGSNPDAAAYWAARMIDAGADPAYLGRRLLRCAYEDIGIADPNAALVAASALSSFERLGPPEGLLCITSCAIYLACAPKSNAAYVAHNVAMSLAKGPAFAVPMRLRNAPTNLLRDIGASEGYRYAHDEPGAYAAGETYLPDEMKNVEIYKPSDRGAEKAVSARLANWKALDAGAKDAKG